MNFASGQHSRDQVGDEDVVRRLVHQHRLARGDQLALEQPVPEQEAHLPVVEPDLAEGLGRVVRADLHAQVAQVELLRRVDLRVAVEQHAQQRRAGADAAHHERRRDEQAVAGLAGLAPAALGLGGRAPQLVARRPRQTAVHCPLERHAAEVYDALRPAQQAAWARGPALAHARGNAGTTRTRATLARTGRRRRFAARAVATLRTTPLAAVTRARTFSVRLRPGASLPILQQARPPSKRPCETDRSRMPGPGASQTRSAVGGRAALARPDDDAVGDDVSLRRDRRAGALADHEPRLARLDADRPERAGQLGDAVAADRHDRGQLAAVRRPEAHADRRPLARSERPERAAHDVAHLALPPPSTVAESTSAPGTSIVTTTSSIGSVGGVLEGDLGDRDLAGGRRLRRHLDRREHRRDVDDRGHRRRHRGHRPSGGGAGPARARRVADYEAVVDAGIDGHVEAGGRRRGGRERAGGEAHRATAGGHRAARTGQRLGHERRAGGDRVVHTDADGGVVAVVARRHRVAQHVAGLDVAAVEVGDGLRHDQSRRAEVGGEGDRLDLVLVERRQRVERRARRAVGEEAVGDDPVGVEAERVHVRRDPLIDRVRALDGDRAVEHVVDGVRRVAQVAAVETEPVAGATAIALVGDEPDRRAHRPAERRPEAAHADLERQLVLLDRREPVEHGQVAQRQRQIAVDDDQRPAGVAVEARPALHVRDLVAT